MVRSSMLSTPLVLMSALNTHISSICPLDANDLPQQQCGLWVKHISMEAIQGQHAVAWKSMRYSRTQDQGLSRSALHYRLFKLMLQVLQKVFTVVILKFSFDVFFMQTSKKGSCVFNCSLWIFLLKRDLFYKISLEFLICDKFMFAPIIICWREFPSPCCQSIFGNSATGTDSNS